MVYTLPALILGFAVVYFTYVKHANFSQKLVLIGFIITWVVFTLIVYLFGTEFFPGSFLLTPIIIGFIVFYLLRKIVNKRKESDAQQ